MLIELLLIDLKKQENFVVKFVFNIEDNVFGYSYLKKAMTMAEEIIEEDSFLEEIGKIDRFVIGNLTGVHASKLLTQNRILKVAPCYPWSQFYKSFGYSVDKEDVIYVNEYKLNKVSLGSLAAMIIHECIPVLDFYDSDSIGRGEHFFELQEHTTTYKINEVATTWRHPIEEGSGFSKTLKYGSFFFCNEIGYEIPRSELYRLTKKYLFEKFPGSCSIL